MKRTVGVFLGLSSQLQEQKSIYVGFNWWLQPQCLNKTLKLITVSPVSLSPWSCLPSLIFSAMRCPLVGGDTGAFSAFGKLGPLVLPSLLTSEDKRKICSVTNKSTTKANTALKLLISVYTSWSVCPIFGWTFSLCQQCFRLVLLIGAVDYLGLTVGFSAVNHCEQSLQWQEVGGVKLPWHWECIL